MKIIERIKAMFRSDARDQRELRAYMQATYTSLQPWRSTASYALEFLKTERANWKFHAQRNKGA